MTNTVLGVLAHVDAGKTTLAEGILYTAGQLRKLGRVDRRDAFLDTAQLERERGITIFSKQAVFPLGPRQITLLDTPGHVDFSAEMERALQVMDCALLVVSGTDGVQSHTRTLWRLLERYQVPTFLFINKMDLPGLSREDLMAQLRARLSDNCLDFTGPRDNAFWEAAALADEDALAAFLESGSLSDDTLRRLIARRKLFPCWFGSALKVEGVAELLHGLGLYLPRLNYPETFSARVYKVETGLPGGRVTHLKITGGVLRVKDTLSGRLPGGEDVWEEKIDQLRLYSGEKFRTLEEAPAGALCAVTGLTHARPGETFGPAGSLPLPAMEPLFTYQVLLPDGCDPYTALSQLRSLEEEDPQLHVVWNSQLREIRLQLMGQVQGEVLKRLIADRFGLDVDFGPGSIVYKETLAAPVIGVGHFEPLRHYAEVHLLLEPSAPGGGLVFRANCDEGVLDPTWQRLVLSQLRAKSHLGVLTGSPVTDLTVTLIAGRAHPKHTEGGDFRQAAWRAMRQGLMAGRSVLLEPWYWFRLELPGAFMGRAISDIQRFGGAVDPPELNGDDAILTGTVAVAAMGDYAADLASYTRGQGRLSCTLDGYRPCKDQDTVVAAIGYDPLRDTENPADSIFCSHGAGHSVPWDEAPGHMHVSSSLPGTDSGPTGDLGSVRTAPRTYAGAAAQDQELQAIFERTYGPIKTPTPRPMSTPKDSPSLPDKVDVQIAPMEDEYLLVDGYNIIFAWDDLKAAAEQNLDGASQLLMEILCNYQGYRGCKVILVFDAYKVHGGLGEVSKYHNITVVYTKEAETADAYIEKVTYRLGKGHRVRVATSDGLIQLIILGHGALRISASAFREEIEAASGSITALIARLSLPQPGRAIAAALEQAMEKKKKKNE